MTVWVMVCINHFTPIRTRHLGASDAEMWREFKGVERRKVGVENKDLEIEIIFANYLM